MSAINFPEEEHSIVSAPKEKRVAFATEEIIHHLPERDALFARLVLKRQVRHLLEMAPSLTPFLDKLLKHSMPSEVKMAEMGVIEAYFEQNRDLDHPSFLDDFIENGGDLPSLLFNFLGETSEARQSAVLAVAYHLGLPDVTACVQDRGVMRMLQGPIQIHPSVEYLVRGYENVQRACIDALFKLPARVDVHFFPKADILNLLLQTLCSGVITLDICKIPIAEMHIDSIPELLLYILRLHDVNCGNFCKGKLIEAAVQHLEERIPHHTKELFQEMRKQLYERLWLEERKQGVIKPFVLVDGHYLFLPTIDALQRAIALIAIESKHCKHTELVRDYITSDAFADFLTNYAMVNNPEATRDNFSLRNHAESSPETLAHAMGISLEFRDFYAQNVMGFLHKLNRVVLQSGTEKLLFVGQFQYIRKEASLFTLPADTFHAALIRKLYLPLKNVVSEKIYLERKHLRLIFKHADVPETISGTPFMIAQKLAHPGEDLLPFMQAIEHHAHLPITLAVGRLADGSHLVCKMNLSKEQPELFQLSNEGLQRLDFENFKSMRMAKIDGHTF